MTAPAGGPASVLLTVGTDHHRFDRVIEWLDAWAAANPDVACSVQYGTSGAPQVADGSDYMPHDELTAAMQSARAVICHGGPATILEVQASGHHPLVVPRDPAHDEHVDDHQVRFSARLAKEEEITVLDTVEALHAALDRVVRQDPITPRAAQVDRGQRGAVTAFGATADAFLLERAEATAAGAAAASTAEHTDQQVLLIAGMGRSGSTLLDRMLGQVDQCASVGEVVHLWTRGLVEGQPCACGNAFRSCAFWSKVGDEAFGGWDQIDPSAVLEAQHLVERDRFLPQLAAPVGVRPSFDRKVEEYGWYLGAVYDAIRQVTGATWVIDSSKHVATAYLLRRLAGSGLRVVHLVRDARGVAYSWTKVKRQFTLTAGTDDGGPGQDQSMMARWEPHQTATRYLAYNTLLQGLAPLGVPTVRVQYEELIAQPEHQMRRVLELIGSDDEELPFLGDGVAELGTSHTVGGNPMRFTAGAVPLRVDDAWREQLNWRDRATVTAVTSPLLAAYGYMGLRGGDDR